MWFYVLLIYMELKKVRLNQISGGEPEEYEAGDYVKGQVTTQVRQI